MPKSKIQGMARYTWSTNLNRTTEPSANNNECLKKWYPKKELNVNFTKEKPYIIRRLGEVSTNENKIQDTSHIIPIVDIH